MDHSPQTEADQTQVTPLSQIRARTSQVTESQEIIV